MKRMSFVPTVLFFSILMMGACESVGDPSTDPDLHSPSSPPPWFNVQMNFENLPVEDNGATLTYTITVTSSDTAYFRTSVGKQLDYLFISFETSSWVDVVNAYNDTLWQGSMEVGQKIVLEPEFQISKTRVPAERKYATQYLEEFTLPLWTMISLRVLVISSANLDHFLAQLDRPWQEWAAYSNYTFTFDHRRGEYKRSLRWQITGPLDH